MATNTRKSNVTRVIETYVRSHKKPVSDESRPSSVIKKSRASTKNKKQGTPAVAAG